MFAITAGGLGFDFAVAKTVAAVALGLAGLLRRDFGSPAWGALIALLACVGSYVPADAAEALAHDAGGSVIGEVTSSPGFTVDLDSQR